MHASVFWLFTVGINPVLSQFELLCCMYFTSDYLDFDINGVQMVCYFQYFLHDTLFICFFSKKHKKFFISIFSIKFNEFISYNSFICGFRKKRKKTFRGKKKRANEFSSLAQNNTYDLVAISQNKRNLAFGK